MRREALEFLRAAASRTTGHSAAPRETADPYQTVLSVLLWSGLLFACLVVLAAAFYVVRSRVARQRRETEGPPLTLAQAREMYQRGDLSAKEYEALKRAIVAEVERSTGRADERFDVKRPDGPCR